MIECALHTSTGSALCPKVEVRVVDAADLASCCALRTKPMAARLRRCRALANRSRWIEMATVRLALIEYGDKKGQFLELDPQEASQLSPCGELA